LKTCLLWLGTGVLTGRIPPKFAISQRKLGTPIERKALSTQVAATADAIPKPAPSWLTSFRIIPRIETYAAVTMFAKTVPGKIVLLAFFTLGLRFAIEDWIPLSLGLAAITFVPVRRRILLTILTLLFTFAVPWAKWPHPFYTSALIVVVIVLGAMFFWLSTSLPRSFIGRHPIFTLLAAYSLLIVFASYFPNDTHWYLTVWDFTAMFGAYLWFIGYSLLDARAPAHDDLGLQLGTYRPFWGSPTTPFVKGSAYLRRIEAKDADHLAVIQLKGLKLLAWSMLIALFSKYFSQCVHGYLAIPAFSDAFLHSVHRAPYPWYMCWASLITAFLDDLLAISIVGHRLVACCRVAGFNALRNTYRPLSSRTVADFWNRYYFYFKELMVDFFFFPVFLNYFKSHKKLRIAVATFAAAGFGNAFYHYVFYLQYISQLGLWRSLAAFHVYLFYCFALAAAITISQMRKRRPAPSGFLRGRIVPAFCVILFYCLLHVFAYTERTYPITEHFRFLAHLFNLSV